MCRKVLNTYNIYCFYKICQNSETIFSENPLFLEEQGMAGASEQNNACFQKENTLEIERFLKHLGLCTYIHTSYIHTYTH